MIGTHNSYTYLNPRYKIFKLFSFMWRTQNKAICKQRNLGVTYFDIRIRRDKGLWRVCHGIVDFNVTFQNIRDILNQFSTDKVRILLERGNSQDKEIFINEAKEVQDDECVSFIGIKKDWIIIVNRDPRIQDFCYVPWVSNLSFWQNIKRFNFLHTIKGWARKYNIPISNKLIKNKSIVYFMDYV